MYKMAKTVIESATINLTFRLTQMQSNPYNWISSSLVNFMNAS